jgi:RimJ/RimL family protein N-acetyltransferase
MPERKLKPFGTKKIRLGKGTLILRPARLSDAKALNGIVNEDGVNDFLLVEKPVSKASTLKFITGDKQHRIIVSELDGKVVGNVTLRPGIGRNDVACGFGIAFSKSVHGKGVAAAALAACLGWMKENGFASCNDHVNEENLRGRKFYKKMGFVETGYIPRDFRIGKRIVGGYTIHKRLG